MTMNSLQNNDIGDLMKYFNARCIVLNVYYLVGNYASHTENFDKIFSEIANTPFAVYFIRSNLSENVL